MIRSANNYEGFLVDKCNELGFVYFTCLIIFYFRFQSKVLYKDFVDISVVSRNHSELT